MHLQLCLICWRNMRLSVRIRYIGSHLVFFPHILSISSDYNKVPSCIAGRYVAETGSSVSPRPAEVLQDGQHHLVTAARDGDMETHNITLQVQYTQTYGNNYQISKKKKLNKESIIILQAFWIFFTQRSSPNSARGRHHDGHYCKCCTVLLCMEMYNVIISHSPKLKKFRLWWENPEV